MVETIKCFRQTCCASIALVSKNKVFRRANVVGRKQKEQHDGYARPSFLDSSFQLPIESTSQGHRQRRG
eukprot:scaffold7330_cov146-Cylindrotheca_fusiformis.AAC.14